jgi:hypothetical protein
MNVQILSSRFILAALVAGASLSTPTLVAGRDRLVSTLKCSAWLTRSWSQGQVR